MAKIDPVGDKYYKPLVRTDNWIDAMFWVSATLSICSVLIDSATYPSLSQIVQIVFAATTVTYFVLGLAQRLYFSPSAEEKRRQDLLSNSFGVNLTHENAEGYYNNEQTSPPKRLAASIMESSFFTQSIVREMLFWQRIKTGAYLLLYFVILLNRTTEIGILVAASQALFSEEVLSRWARMEWLRIQSEKVYNKFQTQFSSGASFTKPANQAYAMESVINYEAGKASAAIVLSTRIFNRTNPALSQEWEKIRAGLKI